jgi:peroxiredoxin Q/BCP
MNKVAIGLISVTIVSGLSLYSQSSPQRTHLKVGDVAPDFTLQSTTGKFTLSDYRGKKVVVLAFFSAAFTGG